MSSNFVNKKSALRKLMKETLKQLSVEEKARQSSLVTRFLLNKSEKFAHAKHIALFLAMRHEELDTIPLIENLLRNKDTWQKRVYVPYIPMLKSISNKSDFTAEMVFYELNSIEQYLTEMNDENKYKLRQFNNVEKLCPVDPKLFDLVLVPGLAFDSVESEQKVSRLGRGKGYYDQFLAKIPHCYTIGIGFNEQFLPLNKSVTAKLPYDKSHDFCLNEFVCENLT